MFFLVLIVCTVCLSRMCISECFSLHVDQSLTKTNKKSQWMCVLNVFHDCTRLVLNTHARVLVGVCLFLIYYDSVKQCTVVSSECSVVNSVLFFFLFFFWWIVKSTKFQCYCQVRSKLWPSWRIFRSLGGVQFGQTTLWREMSDCTTTICHHSMFSSTLSPPLLHTPAQTTSVS